MQIFIRTTVGKVYTIDAGPDMTIGDLKKEIYSRTGVRPDGQKLLFMGKILDDSKTLEHYEIKEECSIYLMLTMVGGHF